MWISQNKLFCIKPFYHMKLFTMYKILLGKINMDMEVMLKCINSYWLSSQYVYFYEISETGDSTLTI